MTVKTRALLQADITEDIAPNRRQAITGPVLRTILTDVIDSALLQNEVPGVGGLGSMAVQDASSVAITGGSITGLIPPLAVNSGGTGAATAGAARTSLGIVPGADVQAYSASLATIASLAVADGNIIVADGAAWSVESGVTARASLGLIIGTDVQAYDADLTAWAAKTAPLGAVIGTTDTQTLTNKAFDAAANTLSGVATAHFATNVIDTDATLAADSDSRIATQKAVRAHVANAIAGTQWKSLSIAAVATANVTQSGEQTIDGVLTSASRVLCVAQTDPILNGAWVTAAGAWARATDSDTGPELFHAAYFVASGGTTYGSTQWTCTNATEPTVGVSNLTFAQIGGATTYTAGTGLGLIGNQFAITDPELLVWAGIAAPSGAVVGISDTQTLTNKTIAAGSNTVSGLATSMFAANVVDTDVALAANSDTRLASQKATKAYVDGQVSAIFATFPTAAVPVAASVTRVGVMKYDALSEYRFTGYVEVAAPDTWTTATVVTTTVNIALSGLQTINGVTLVADDLVNVAAQTIAADNGIWIAAAGAWTRAVYTRGDRVLNGSGFYVCRITHNRLKAAVFLDDLAAGKWVEFRLKFQALDGRWFQIEDRRVDIRSAGARKASNTNTAAVQLALNTARPIYVPGSIVDQDYYRCENPIYVNFDGQIIFGDGKEQSVLEFSSSTANCVVIDGDPANDGTGQIVGCGMQNVGLRHTGSPTGGAMVRGNGSNRMVFFAVQMKNGFDHVHLSRCSFNDFISCWSFGPQRTAMGGAVYRITKNDHGGNTNNNFYGCDGLSTSSYLDGIAEAWMEFGFHIEECDGVYSMGCHFNRTHVVIDIDPPNGDSVSSLWFDHMYCDSSYSRALWIHGGGAASARMIQLKFHHCHFRDARGLQSVLVDPDSALLQIEFRGCAFNDNRSASFRAVENGAGTIRGLVLDGNTFANNNRDQDLLANPIINAASEVTIKCDGFNVRGNEVVKSAVTGLYCYAFITVNSNSMNGTVENNDASANSTWAVAPYVDNSTSPTVVFRNNKDAEGQSVALTASRTLLRAENGKRFTNEGAGGQIIPTLPAAKKGLVFEFMVVAAFNMRITAGTGDIIHSGADISAAAGRIDNNAIGSTVRLEAMNATDWFVTAASPTVVAWPAT